VNLTVGVLDREGEDGSPPLLEIIPGLPDTFDWPDDESRAIRHPTKPPSAIPRRNADITHKALVGFRIITG
jgi:hypothetical protein